MKARWPPMDFCSGIEVGLGAAVTVAVGNAEIEVGAAVAVGGSSFKVAVVVTGTAVGEMVTCGAQEASKTAARRNDTLLILLRIVSSVKI